MNRKTKYILLIGTLTGIVGTARSYFKDASQQIAHTTTYWPIVTIVYVAINIALVFLFSLVLQRFGRQ